MGAWETDAYVLDRSSEKKMGWRRVPAGTPRERRGFCVSFCFCSSEEPTKCQTLVERQCVMGVCASMIKIPDRNCLQGERILLQRFL